MKNSLFILFFVLVSVFVSGQQAYFVDGFHGGIYGHYPVEWNTKFMADLISKYPEWRMCLEIEPETWDTVAVRTPDDYALFRKIATNRRVEFTNPAYAQPYCYNVSGESIIRQFYYGIKKIKSHFPDVEFVTYSVEEPCFTSGLPQILKQYGFKYAVLKCPNTCWGGYMAPYGGELVNWIGPDGSSILTVPRYECEELEKNSVWQTTAWSNDSGYLKACFKQGIEHPVGMTFQDAGWKGGPWIGKGDSIKNNSKYVTWREYFENISNGSTTDNYRLSQEDVRTSLMWGSQVLQRIARQVRHSENSLAMAEKMGVIANLSNNYRYKQKTLDEAWRTLMLAQHHDSWIVPYNRLRQQKTWADQIQLWTTATDSLCRGIISEAEKSFSSGKVLKKGLYLRVYNTPGIARSEIVSTKLPQGLTGSNLKVTDATGKEIDNFVTTGANGEPTLLFEAAVPAFGYATYFVEPIQKITKKNTNKNVNKPDDTVLENSLYRMVIDPLRGGVIKSLVAKKEGAKEFADSGSEFSIGELRGFFYDEGVFHSSTETTATVTVTQDNPFEKSVRIQGYIASHPFTQTITLKEGQRKIEFDLAIDWKNNVGIGEYRQTDAYKNNRRAFYNDRFKLNMLFPVNLKSPTLYKNAPFDVCRSKQDNTFYNTWDSIKHNIILNWIDLTEGDNKKGFALLSDHTTSYSYGDDVPLGLTVQFSGNGLWGRDYRIDGPTNLRFAIIPHSGEWDKSGIPDESLRWNEPLICSFLPETELKNASLIDICDTGYEISAAYLSGDDIVVRFFNASGNMAPQTIKFGTPLSKIEEIDLNENTLATLKPVKTSTGTELKLVIPRFGLKTLRLTKEQAKTPADYVNPFIGASTSTKAAGVYHGLGKTFPGATTPYGMVQVSPNTITGGDNGSGYSYEHETIEGFAFTQMSGVGWYGDLGNFLVMPTTGALKKIAGKEDGSIPGYRSHYDKSSECAKAGFYSVNLTDYGINVQSSATPRCGILKFTFPESKKSRIQIDLARRVGGTSTEQYIKVIDKYTIRGRMKCTPEGGGWGNGEGKADYTVYFFARFSKPLENYGMWSADIPDGWSRKRDDVTSIPYLTKVAEAPVITGKNELQGKHLGFYGEFSTQTGEEITLKAGISFVDMKGAENNFNTEIARLSFDEVKAQAHEQWNRELSRIKISGGSADEKTIFYTALYHTMIDPRIFIDADGRYVGGDGRIYSTGGTFTKRTIFSGWDVFRSQFPLQVIINPRLVSDQLNSLITLAEQSGKEYFNRWEIVNAYSGCMLGNPAISVLADAYIKGIRTFDIEKAYAYAKNSSREFGNDKLGYTASGGSISHTLEYAYTDWCIGQLASALGKNEEATEFYKKGQAYRNIFDREKNWFRPRNADGSWVEWPENGRLTQGYGCIESNPYQQGWFVPHDLQGMVELMGGREAVLADLKEMFEKTPQDLLWNDYYNHANEPVHFVPFLFNKLGEPWNTQKWSRFICKNGYRNEVEGIVGNEDAGQMSAWYVLAASGLHPSCPGDTRFEITAPVFDRIEIRLDTQYAKGEKFTIVAHNNSSSNLYIQKARLNGKEYDKCYLDFFDIAGGGTLELFMGDTPNKEWGK